MLSCPLVDGRISLLTVSQLPSHAFFLNAIEESCNKDPSLSIYLKIFSLHLHAWPEMSSWMSIIVSLSSLYNRGFYLYQLLSPKLRARIRKGGLHSYRTNSFLTTRVRYKYLDFDSIEALQSWISGKTFGLPSGGHDLKTSQPLHR